MGLKVRRITQPLDLSGKLPEHGPPNSTGDQSMPSVLITGVNRGLGFEFIKQYTAAGWQVIGTCRDISSATEASALAAGADNLSLYQLDVGDSAAISSLAEQLNDTALDVLILNAGVMGMKSIMLGEIEAEDFRQVLNINVVSQALLLQAFQPHVAAGELKIIVGMGSIIGSIGAYPDGGLYSYRASKAAVSAIMKGASLDLKDQGITVITMHPGWVQTDMGGEGAQITPEVSIAGMREVIAGLAPSDSGRFFTYSGDELPW
jgi:NAD(P)-dependent dehydrogenase (short-subunit alcohol dehydrogenase family)